MSASSHIGPAPDRSGLGALALGLLDTAVEIQGRLVQRNIARARRRRHEATSGQAIRTLERLHVMSGGEVLTAMELTTHFALSVADVHGVPLDEVERRRTLVLGLMLGGNGRQVIAKGTDRTPRHWARTRIVADVPMQKLHRINRVLGKRWVTKYGTKQGVLVLGQLVPFGIGFAIGGGANALLAGGCVGATRLAFGPAPESWPAG
ncbi:hypothetical protein GCM10009639_19620 [Kitasatospora putterlickiae]|uniref:Uncharacterized protein n=1 Tax=Kitasatospora putterlickiae TaxID=221725 RepID=A0ABP4IH92_9ACTN